MAMTKVKVEICYDDKSRNKELILDVKGAPKGLRLMNAAEKAVEKAMKGDDAWTRWNLLDVLTAETLPEK